MKIFNAIRSKWMRRVSGLLATLMLTMSFAGQASAIILFQDDDSHDIDSEALTINANDGGDEDATLQFGNDTTDATITFDDGTGDLTIATPANAEVIVGSGTGLDFSGSDMFRIREDTDPATNAECKFVGELIYDTTDDELQICTAVANPGTWAAVSAGGADFESVYANDADDTLTATNFTIDASGNLIFDADGSVTIGGAGIGLTSDGGALALTGDGAADIDIANAGAAIDVDSATLTVDTTSSFSIDGAADASNITLAANGAADDLTVEVTGAQDASLVLQSTGTGTDAVDINATAGGITIDTATAFSIDGADASNMTIASDGAADDLTIEVTGATDSSLVLQSTGTGTDAIDINATAGDIDIDATNDNGITIDATESSNLSVATDAAGEDLTIAVTGATDSSILLQSSGTGTDAIGLTTTAGSISIDAQESSTWGITGNDAGDQTLTISAANAGVGSGFIVIGSDTWNISSAGVATGFTGITSTGVIDFSGASRLALHQGAANPTPCTEGDIFYNTATNTTSICTVTGNPGTWTALSSGNPDFETVYGTDADDTLTASATFDIDAVGAVGIDSDAGITIGGAGIGLTSDGGALALTGDGAADIDILNAGAAIDVDSATLVVDTTSSFSIDGAADASNITLASDGAADDLTIGVTGATDSSLVLQSTGTGTDAIDINATAGGIDVDTTDGAIAINAGGAANGDITIDAGDDFLLDAVGLFEINSSAGVISIGNDDIDQNINLGTNGERLITIGNSVGATALDLNANGAIGINSDDGSVTIGADDTDNAANDNVVLLSGNAAPDAGENGNDIALEAEDDVLIEATDAVDIDSASMSVTTSGQTTIDTSTWDISGAGVGSNFTGFTSTGIVNFSGSTEFRIREVAGITNPGTTCTTVGELIMDTTNNVLYTCINAGTNAWTSTSAKVDTMVFEPEYPNYTLWGDGGSNNGKMEALYDSTNREQHYRWTTKKSALHDYDIRFRYTLPDDFSAVGDLVTRIRTATTNPVITDNAVDITLRNDTDNTQCATSATNASAVNNTWTNITIAAAAIGNCGGQTLVAGDVIEIILKMHVDETNSGITDVGTISLAYTN